MGPVDLAPGSWRTLESFYGSVGSTIAVFRVPAGVRLKVRYGWGWFGYNRQGKTTDGENDKRLQVSGFVGRARMQARVSIRTTLSWTRITEGP
ncbi:MAG: hypothetical protein ABI047_08640 [Jatrophihabitantaceae bacterium]